MDVCEGMQPYVTNEHINSIPFILHIFKNNFHNEVGSPVNTITITQGREQNVCFDPYRLDNYAMDKNTIKMIW